MDEALLLDPEGYGPRYGEYFHRYAMAVLYTLELRLPGLDGITVLRSLPGQGAGGVRVKEKRITRDEVLYLRDEAFFTGTAAGYADS